MANNTILNGACTYVDLILQSADVDYGAKKILPPLSLLILIPAMTTGLVNQTSFQLLRIYMTRNSVRTYVGNVWYEVDRLIFPLFFQVRHARYCTSYQAVPSVFQLPRTNVAGHMGRRGGSRGLEYRCLVHYVIYMMYWHVINCVKRPCQFSILPKNLHKLT